MERISSSSQSSFIPLSLPENISNEDLAMNNDIKKKSRFDDFHKKFFRRKQAISNKKQTKVGVIEPELNSSNPVHNGSNGIIFQTKHGSNGTIVRGQTNKAFGIEDEDKLGMHTTESPDEAAESVKTGSEELIEEKQDGKFTYKLTRQNSTEKFAHLSLLTPAFILHPEIHGSDTITQKFTNTSNANFQLKLAAAHVTDAIKGYGKFGEARAIFQTKLLQRCFKITSSKIWKSVMYLVISVHCLMAFWEQPARPILFGDSWFPWYVNPAVLVIDALCLLIYVFDLTLHIMFSSLRNIFFAKEKVWIRLEFVLTVCFIIDFIVLIIETATQTRLLCPFRCFRGTMLLCKSKNVSHIFSVLVSTFTKLVKVLLIIILFIVMSSAVGLHVFMEDYHDLTTQCTNGTDIWDCPSMYSGAFDNVAIASLQMFVLITTANYPFIITPAFSKNWVNFTYFGLFFYVGVFFLESILLAITVDAYWDYSKKHVKEERRRQREELAKAWNLMDPLGSGLLSVDDPKLLELFAILKPKNTVEENVDLIKYMSMYDDGVIDSYDWTTKLIDALTFVFENEDTDCESSSPLCCSSWSKVQTMCKTFIHDKVVNIAILLLLILHSILFCAYWSGMSDIVVLAIQSTKTAIIVLFVLEMILRIIADGRSLLNLFDFLDMLMIVFAAAAYIAWYILFFRNPRAGTVYLGACSIVSGLSILIRTIFNSQYARRGVHILRNIYPVMFDLTVLIFTIIFFYSVVGLELLQNQSISDVLKHGYGGAYLGYNCGVGFETLGCSLIMVFQIVTTNVWQENMYASMHEVGWPCVIYFAPCYLMITIVVMNLFVAIAIEAYKKLPQNDSVAASNNINSEDPEEKIQTEETSLKSTAKKKLNKLFASSRKTESGSGSGTLTGYTSSPYTIRKGIFKSMAPMAFIREGASIDNMSIFDSSSRGYSTRRNSRTMVSGISSVSTTMRGVDRRQWALKQRENRKKKERKLSRQEEKKAGFPGASLTDEQRNAIRSFHARTQFRVSSSGLTMGSWETESKLDALPSRLQRRSSQISQGRIRRRSTVGAWRRSILGEITVMNNDEFNALQGKFRGGLEKRRASVLSTTSNQLPLQMNEDLLEHHEEEHHEKDDNVFPELTASEASIESKNKQEEDILPSTDTITTTVPEHRKVAPDKRKRADGEIPDWATKFMSEKQLTTKEDVKVGERSTAEEEGNITTIPNVVDDRE